MRGRCVVLEQLSPGRLEVVTSGGERDHRTHGTCNDTSKVNLVSNV